MREVIERRLEEARSGGAPMTLEELEDLYTTGCAEVLELEAGALRTARRLKQLRDDLRDLRTAIEFLQEEHGNIGSDRT